MLQKFLCLFVGFILVALPVPALAQQGSGKPIVAVYEMRDLTNNGLADTFSTMIATAVAGTSKFRVIERNDMDKLLGEQNRANSGLVTTNKPSKKGGFEGADYLIYGTITSLSVVNKSDVGTSIVGSLFTPQGSAAPKCVYAIATVSVDIKITDASTGEIKYVDRIDEQQKSATICDGRPSVDNSGLLRAAADKVATGLVQAIYPIQVAAIQSDGVFILNYGEGALNVGDILTLYSKGEAIYDPATGELLANSEVKLGYIRVTEVNGRVSKAVPVSEFTAAPAVGAIARATSAEDRAALAKPAKKRK
ncbi:hypothetical protein ABI_27250 [Asticcacaulis biprosthecium C19]|uniref:Curli production assembly/transport component CsgG n=1 Tax=Asticcacaulis biprosthecium C19 TaxID=715226 RepID=F4QM69_9CAUL|nr:CsgG/HfaB family protein [Asticcacaulis biprosthecium]EGF91310.1 hypothetical protein ABI_27250 [Asticcacaulis biprosthecium C19]